MTSHRGEEAQKYGTRWFVSPVAYDQPDCSRPECLAPYLPCARGCGMGPCSGRGRAWGWCWCAFAGTERTGSGYGPLISTPAEEQQHDQDLVRSYPKLAPTYHHPTQSVGVGFGHSHPPEMTISSVRTTTTFWPRRSSCISEEKDTKRVNTPGLLPPPPALRHPSLPSLRPTK